MRKYFFCGLIWAVACHGGGGSNIQLDEGTRYVNNSSDAQWVTLPDSSRIKLSSGTEVVVGAGFSNRDRVVDLNGEGMFEVREMPGRMFVVMTGNLVITGPGSRFRVDAVRKRPGEEVDLLAGQLTIRKSYHSDLDSVAEELSSGDMLMINREIDLMEKEKMSAEEVEKARAKF